MSVINPNVDDRRYKILHVPLDFCVNLFLDAALKIGDCVTRYRIVSDQIPEGMRVANITYSHMFQGWCILLYHSSFPDVPSGKEIPPLLPDGLKVEIVTIGDDTEIKSTWRSLPAQF